jgi:FAD/FMN-containing dehydrogenase
MSTLPAIRIEKLKVGFRGRVFVPGSDGYEDARTIWNAMIDRRPAIIARCANVSDVVRAIEVARDNGLPVAVRGGGHNIAGNAMVDGGVVIDLSSMRSVLVDPSTRRVTVEGGATLGDLDAATQVYGLATPLGINSTTGVGGLTLGGGFGWLSRRYGMTVDNLESAEVVTASGEVMRASAGERADLFWAVRGGGGNFGVVTRFELGLHPVGPQVWSGLIVYPGSSAREVLRGYRDFAAQAPDELSVWAILRHAPPLPFLPAEVHGRPIVALALIYTGDSARGEKLVQPLRSLTTLAGEHLGLQPYVAWQQAFDPLLAAGARNYWKSHNLSALGDELIDLVADRLQHLPSPQSEIFVAALGGAASRFAPDATAYVQRDAQLVMNVHARWDHEAEDQRCIGWAREFFAASAPFATGGVYVNFLTADEDERVRAAYGSNYARLAEVKRTYDPENLFRVNQNIRPS